MAKSRTPLWLALALALAPAPAAAQTASVEQLIERQRAELEAALRPGCERDPAEDEILVCGARAEERRYRVEAPLIAGAGPDRRAGGEQRAALAVDSSPCTTVGRDQRCNGGLDVIGIGVMILQAVAQALANRD